MGEGNIERKFGLPREPEHLPPPLPEAEQRLENKLPVAERPETAAETLSVQPLETPRRPTINEVERADPVLHAITGEAGVQGKWFTTEAYTTGHEALAAITEAVLNAEEAVEMQVFSWEDDDSGHALAEALRELHSRKPEVPIHLQVDLLGCLFVGSFPKNKWERIKLLAPKIPRFIREVIRLGIWSPWTWYRAWRARNNVQEYERLKPKERRKLATLAGRLFTEEELFSLNNVLQDLRQHASIQITPNDSLDRINHTKRYRIDKKTFVGGMNIGNNYLGKNPWKDYLVCLTEESEEPVSANHVPVWHLRNESGYSRRPERKQVTHAMLTMVEQAQHTIVIEHAYVMSRTIHKALSRALARGVNVTIIRGQPEDPAIEAANEESFQTLNGAHEARGRRRRQRAEKQTDRLLQKLTRQSRRAPGKLEVLRSPRVLHSKLLITDDTYVLVGSANLTRDSLYRHGEEAILMKVEDQQPEDSAPKKLRAAAQASIAEARAYQAV